MTETLYINREWTYGEEETKSFTLEELLNIQKTLNMDGEEFSEFITGLNEDEYADNSCDMLKEMYTELSENDEEEYKLENAYTRCMKTAEFLTCYTVWRLWNSEFTTEEALKLWKDSCITTLEGMLEDMDS